MPLKPALQGVVHLHPFPHTRYFHSNLVQRAAPLPRPNQDALRRSLKEAHPVRSSRFKTHFELTDWFDTLPSNPPPSMSFANAAARFGGGAEGANSPVGFCARFMACARAVCPTEANVAAGALKETAASAVPGASCASSTTVAGSARNAGAFSSGASSKSSSGSKHWKAGTGSGPFDWEMFARELRRDQFHRECQKSWGARKHQHHQQQRYPHRFAKCDHHDRKMRYIQRRMGSPTRDGFAYFLATQAPMPPREMYERESRNRPWLDQDRPYSNTSPFDDVAPSPKPSCYSLSRSRITAQLMNSSRPTFTPGSTTFPLSTSLLNLPISHIAPLSSVHARLMSTASAPRTIPSSCSSCLEAGFPLLLPLTTLLKSSAALNVISVVSRLALTLLPLSVRSKVIYMMKERYLRNPDAASSWLKGFMERGGSVAHSASARLNANFILPFLISLPLLLLGITVAASYERTPVTGRPRIVMLSPEEEAGLVTSVLSVGNTVNPGVRDWITILASVLHLGDEGFSSVSGRRVLLGGEVLDDRDWRVRWTAAVLRALEEGVPGLAADPNSATSGSSADFLTPPPTKFPLKPRPVGNGADAASAALSGPLLAHYDLLVVDRKEPNAFSFGFGPDESTSDAPRGVIVVYSGFIDEILGASHGPSPISMSEATRPTSQMATLFGNLFPSRKPAAAETLPNLVPSTLPSPAQTKSLAVLLSHELAHLVLSHTLESYASTSLLIPHVSKLLSDVARTLVYPVTMLLGPFVQDAIGKTMHEGASDGFGVLGRYFNTCESLKLEEEADMVSLRLLANSGIDPRFALDFWEERLAHPPSPAMTESALDSHPASHLFRLHTASPHPANSDAATFLRTHPVNEDRVRRIKAELEKWLAYQALNKSS